MGLSSSTKPMQILFVDDCRLTTLQATQARYEAERARGLAQVEAACKRYTEREATLTAAADKQTKDLAAQVNELRDTTRVRIAQVEEATRHAQSRILVRSTVGAPPAPQ